jgi:hypothetical protein
MGQFSGPETDIVGERYCMEILKNEFEFYELINNNGQFEI